jgi:hypothetical protein
MNRIRLLERVVEALCEAEEGGRELDGRIALALGGTRSESDKLLNLFLEEDYDWRTVSALLDAQVPDYTTSLDAAVPGETIVGVLFSERRGRWAAVHRAPDGVNGEPIWTANEALARRAAGLAGLLREARSDAGARAEPKSGPADAAGLDHSGSPKSVPGPLRKASAG